MDILEFSLPNRWRTTMTIQGFNAAEKTTAEFIKFCERLEMTDPNTDMMEDRIPKKKQASGPERKQSATKRKRGDEDIEDGEALELRHVDHLDVVSGDDGLDVHGQVPQEPDRDGFVAR